ncbi:polysaccharide biosynthesis protein [Zymomonas mobilis subsp. mobilis ZM4 = ATCC 31821]|uniref:Polysaccharide biosynthesis protein n=1 Tax=Zymomonas mobilis subsp. mobilis (strain ATCC 31821 / ZM4 / CP4) TaxID=264203 RepID=Q5NMX0_ZYMMO|nr:lipopolysaccharide biosynthesis protein [Zymomonas mobilis]AAV89940.1 polysaccharide biosynthesis protein [Zymomonas mobilis subsp. mobilis ZM4 = ATCC 31821]AVZ26186.1 polysaccharide biosynthesis protein [Zymomonas mobilis subsp. mobilis]AVZ28073.1 polysaccharide biosynthesis protein [Zymomonas mobilis subsp. mobilis]AVZ42518.1 polysaccharide biosynthesis protein [Zymomonas mobilis subsp. mobilis ZM4 = ATCC 31821]UBQ07286.1 lipopolysaccharide biosynthesis protein [Zymomonas mobilis]
MSGWLKDRVFRTVLKNAGYLGSTKLIGALIGLGALIGAGRMLTAVEFGTLMLIHTYALGVGALTKFQSWQMILKFGARPYEQGNRSIVAKAIRFAVGLDMASGVFGMVVGMTILCFAASYVGIGQQYTPIALLYCTLIPTMSSATPTGVLRLVGRFDLLAKQQIITPLLRGVGALLSWIFGLGFVSFVATWYLADIAGDLVLWVMTIKELRERDMQSALRPSLREAPASLPGVWNFVWLTNLNTTLDACWSPVGNLIVGGMLGAAAAGRYKIATTLLDSAIKPANFLEKGFYPEIMRLDPKSRHPWYLALRTGLLSGAIGLCVMLVILIGGKPLISLFGHKYAEASTLMAIMSPALVISMACFPLESLLYMAGQAKAVLVAQIVSVITYITALVCLTHTFGLHGAGISYIFGVFLLNILVMIPALIGYTRRHLLESETVTNSEV